MQSAAPRRRVLRLVATALATVAALPAAARASEALPAPSGRVVLTLSGRVAHTNGGGAARLDMAMIEAMERATVTTLTPWYDGEQVFEGVPLRALLREVGASGQKLIVRALNNYMAEIPLADAEARGAILAYRRNGKPMPVRDKGPLFVIYPYSSDQALQNEVYYGRSAWQVSRIAVE